MSVVRSTNLNSGDDMAKPGLLEGIRSGLGIIGDELPKWWREGKREQIEVPETSVLAEAATPRDMARKRPTRLVGADEGVLPTSFQGAFEAVTPQTPGEAAFALASGPARFIKPAMRVAAGGGAALMASGDAEAAPLSGVKRSAKYLAKLAQDAGYLDSPPTKPHPLVGKRFDIEQLPGLADKHVVDLESLHGASIMPVPWDSTSRKYRVRSVSGIPLPEPVVTTGGQGFARDLQHIAEGVGGASNKEIAERIMKRALIAQEENLKAGGNGRVFMLPSTMGAGGENFSSNPTNILLQLMREADLNKKEYRLLNEDIRSSLGDKGRVYGGFVGFDSPDLMHQLRTGEGLATTPGELRKQIVNRLTLKGNQERLNFNHEDLVAAITDPDLRGVGKGHIGNTLIEANPRGSLTPSTHPDYSHNFPGQYGGSLGFNAPIEVLTPDVYERLALEFANKPGHLRNMTIGAMEKRNKGVAQMVNDRVLESAHQWRQKLMREAQ